MTPAYVVGDAVYPATDGKKIIAHICNDRGLWGAGFVVALAHRYPKAREEYIRHRMLYPLGTTQMVRVDHNTYVANMIGQRGVRSSTNPVPLDLDALAKCLVVVRDMVLRLNASVHMPRIGCGLAGGRWEEVEPVVQVELCDHGVPVTVYDLR